MPAHVRWLDASSTIHRRDGDHVAAQPEGDGPWHAGDDDRARPVPERWMTTRVALVTPDTWLVLNDSDVVIGTIALNVSGFIAITLRAIAAITTRLPT